MAIDQRDVSSTLRFMDDRALQQYAAMHKSDPYIFPLAFQESQNRQRLRMNQQSAQGMQPQPKVNEQALAQMAPPQAQPMPEAQGIGALPAGNMETMADGGIAGYDDDANFAERSEPVVMMAGGGVARYQAGGSIEAKYRQESMEMGMGARVQYSPDVQAYARAQAQPSEEEQQAFRDEQQRMLAGGRFNAFPPLPKVDARSTAAPTATTKVSPTYSPDDYSGMDRRIMSGSQLPSIQSITPPAKPAPTGNRDAAPKADTTRRNTTDPSAERKEPAIPEQTAAQRYAAMQKGLEPERAEIDKGIASLAASKRKAVTDELSEFEKDVAERGVAFKGREERTAKKEAELGKRKGELGSFAMLEFGLGLLAEPGSFARAVGRVGQTTAKNYSAGLKDLRAAQDKLDDTRDQIEEFRRNENNMTAAERRKFKSAIGRTENEIEQLGLNAAEKMYGNKREDAKNIFTADTQERLTRMEIGSKERIAARSENRADARANAPTPDMREAMMLGTGNTPEEKYLSGLKVKKDLLGDKQGTQLLKLFLEENGRREKNMEKPLTLDQFRRTSAAFYAPPAPVDTTKPTRP
jgi:hypothetical protein